MKRISLEIKLKMWCRMVDTAGEVICIAALLTFGSTETLNLGRCPPPSLKQLVADTIGCHPLRNFHCLYDLLEEKYNTYCFPAQKLTAGGYVFIEGNLNSRSCPPNLYQPKPYWSSDFSECVYHKSLCNEEGQIIYQNGSTLNDRSCRCDYRRGYDFVYRPKNPCFCQPSVEDCSCYLKRCPRSDQRLNPDYQCSSTRGLSTCPILPPITDDSSSSFDSREYKPTVVKDTRLDSTKYNSIGKGTGVPRSVVIVLTIITLCIILVCTTFLIVKELLDVTKGLTYEEVSANAEIEIAMSNKCYVETSNYSDIDHMLHKHKLVILNGRVGSGKKTLALRIADKFLKKNYKCVLLRSEAVAHNLFYPQSTEKYLVVFQFNESLVNVVKNAHKEQIHHLLNFQRDIKVLILIQNVSSELNDILRMEKFPFVDEVTFDIKYSWCERNDILINYLKQSQCDVECDEETQRDIVGYEPYLGFPLLCKNFCCDPELMHLGKVFFSQPPDILVCEIDQMIEKGSRSVVDAYNYCSLLSVLMEPEHIQSLDQTKIKNLMSRIFQWQGKISESTIQGAYYILMTLYLKRDGNENLIFRHHTIYDAVLVSCVDMFPEEAVKLCDVKSLMLLTRPMSYTPRKGEVCFHIADQNKDAYANRLLQECLQSNDNAIEVGDYLKSFSDKFENKELVKDVITCLSKKVKINEMNTAKLLTFFSRFLDSPLDSSFTSDEKEYTFLASYQVLSASKYNNREALTSVMKDIVDSNLETQFLMTKVDRLGNTMMHYFCIWTYEREENIFIRLLDSILKKSTDFKPIVYNCKKQSPFNFVTYLGRPELFQRLLPYYKKTLLKPSSMVGPELIALLEKGQKHAKQGLSMNDPQVAWEYELCRENPIFGSSSHFSFILDIIDKNV